jgi:HEAT repeat protein
VTGSYKLAEAAAQADALAEAGDERALAKLRLEWDDDLEMSARSPDFRERAAAYRAIAQFRFRQKTELLRRGLEDQSPACRGSALVSIEAMSRESPGVVNKVRPMLHTLASSDPNAAVRRLAIMTLKNASPQQDTIRLLKGLAEDDEQDRELRDAAHKVSELLRKRAATAR